jgi:hypothetical protein
MKKHMQVSWLSRERHAVALLAGLAGEKVIILNRALRKKVTEQMGLYQTTLKSYFTLSHALDPLVW